MGRWGRRSMGAEPDPVVDCPFSTVFFRGLLVGVSPFVVWKRPAFHLRNGTFFGSFPGERGIPQVGTRSFHSRGLSAHLNAGASATESPNFCGVRDGE